MNDERISFDTAKLAREKGFDELITPTQSLLAKWLREEHRIVIVIKPFVIAEDPTRHIFYDYDVYGDGLESPKGSDEFLTYEKAFEVALYKALQLI